MSQVRVHNFSADHLEPGGRFVAEAIVPQLRRVPPGNPARVFTLDPGHVGIETLRRHGGARSRGHITKIQAHGRVAHHCAPDRYVWPSELDLIAKITGCRLRDR